MAGSDKGKEGIFRSSRNLAVSTLVCRILGFLREMIMAPALGGGMRMSAWVLAITLPNLFRRILGEGALGTALIPMMVHSMGNEDRQRARERFSTIFLYLTVLLGAITVLVTVPALIAAPLLPEGMWKTAAELTPIVMPYSIFICAVGILTSYANSLRVYFLPSLAAILQNVIMITALLLIWSGYSGSGDPLRFLSFAVLISGVLELLLMFWVVKRENMMIILNRMIPKDFETIKAIWKLALPGIGGASALQLSLIVDRLVAGKIGDYAPASLYFSERLVYLPIGIFAFAFGTVSVSEMARAAVKKDFAEMIGMLVFSLRNLLYVTVPIAVFMFLFREDLITLFFMRGRFDAESVRQTAYAMSFYVTGIPLFAAYKVIVAGFTARKDMVTPLKVTCITVSLNIILNLILMIPLRQGGVALATVISSLTGNLILALLLVRAFGKEPFAFRPFFLMLIKLAAAGSAAGLASWAAARWCPFRLGPVSLTHLVAGGIAFALVFFPVSLLLRIEEADLFLARYLKLKIRKRS